MEHDPARTLKHFDLLVSQGLRVIPLREGTKIPISKGWTNWNKQTARNTLLKFPMANIGLLLGEIIDVEGDSEKANRKILELIKDYPHPCYSSQKSIHHLFRNPDPSLTILKYRDIEFRGSRHQSVLPPSHLANGISYRWLETTKFPIPEMPKELRDFYFQIKSQREKSPIKPGHAKIACSQCGSCCFLHRKRLNLEIIAFRDVGERWSCRNCRQVDLRPACRLIRRRMSERTLV